MKKMIAIGLAGALATASVAATTQSAQAWTPGAAFVVGAVVGVGVAALLFHAHPFTTLGYANSTYSYAPGGTGYTTYSYAGNDHVAWCQSNYRSYNLATDTFHGFDGLDHRCVSPAY